MKPVPAPWGTRSPPWPGCAPPAGPPRFCTSTVAGRTLSATLATSGRDDGAAARAGLAAGAAVPTPPVAPVTRAVPVVTARAPLAAGVVATTGAAVGAWVVVTAGAAAVAGAVVATAGPVVVTAGVVATTCATPAAGSAARSSSLQPSSASASVRARSSCATGGL